MDDRILKTAKQNGFTDKKVAELWEINEEAVRQMRKENDLIPVYKMVDTCAAEFESKTDLVLSVSDKELNLTMRLCILSKQSSRQDTRQSS